MCGFLSRIRVSHYYFSHWHAYLIHRSSSSSRSAPLSCGIFFPSALARGSVSLFPAQTLGAANYRAKWRAFPRSPDSPSHSFFNKIKMDGRRGGDVLSWRCKAQPLLLVSIDVLSRGWFLRVSHVFPDDSWFWAHMIIACTVQWHIVMICHGDIYNNVACVLTAQGLKKKGWLRKAVAQDPN